MWFPCSRIEYFSTWLLSIKLNPVALEKRNQVVSKERGTLIGMDSTQEVNDPDRVERIPESDLVLEEINLPDIIMSREKTQIKIQVNGVAGAPNEQSEVIEQVASNKRGPAFVHGESSVALNEESIVIEEALEQSVVRDIVSIQLTLHQRVEVVKKRDTVCARFMSQEALDYLYKWVWKSISFRLIMYIAWISLAIVCICLVCNIHLIPNPVFTSLQIIFIVYFTSFQLAFINIGVFWIVLKSFNFWFLFFHSFLACASVLYMWDWDFTISLVCFHTFIGCVFLILVDTYTFTKKKLVGASFVAGGLFLTVICIVIKIPTAVAEKKNEELRLFWGLIFNLRSQISDSLSVLVVYFVRVLVFKLYKDPREMSLLEESYVITVSKSKLISNIAPFFSKPFTVNTNQKTNRLKSSKKILPIAQGIGKGASTLPRLMPVGLEDPTVKDQNIASINQPIILPNYAKQNPDDYILVGITKIKTIALDNYHTIYHLYLQEKYPCIHNMLASDTYNSVSALVIITSSFLWVVLTFGFEFTFATRFLVVSWMSLSIVNLTMQMILTSNILMVKKMFRSFDYWYVTWLSIQITVSGGFLVGIDWRFVVWAWLFFGTQWLMFIDSFPLKMRKLTWFSVIGIVFGFIACFLSKIGYGSMFSDNMTLSWGQIELINMKDVCSSSVFSWCLFMCRFLYGYWKNPNRSLFVTKKLRKATIQSVIEMDGEI